VPVRGVLRVRIPLRTHFLSACKIGIDGGNRGRLNTFFFNRLVVVYFRRVLWMRSAEISIKKTR
jgi:hypothetical protein